MCAKRLIPSQRLAGPPSQCCALDVCLLCQLVPAPRDLPCGTAVVSWVLAEPGEARLPTGSGAAGTRGGYCLAPPKAALSPSPGSGVRVPRLLPAAGRLQAQQAEVAGASRAAGRVGQRGQRLRPAQLTAWALGGMS